MDAISGAIVFTCLIGFYAYLFVAAFSTKRTVERVRARGRVPILLLLLVVALVLGTLGGRATLPGDFFAHRALSGEVTADVIAIFGFVIAVWARTVLAGNWSSTTSFKERHELIERGAYRYVRHPIYSGLLLMVVGLVIWLGSITSLIILAAALIMVIARIRSEEALLTRHFPTAYPEYRRRTKALIPFMF